jgi:lysophospholipase L1-like esterase
VRGLAPAILAVAALGLALPNIAGARSSDGNAEKKSPPKRRYVVAAIGDSLTDIRAGGGKYLAALSKKCPESRFDAYGVGGQRTDHMRWRFVSDLFGKSTPWRKKPHYTHVIVLGGVNDLAAASMTDARIGRIERNLAYMYKKGRAKGLGVIAVTVPPFGRLKGSVDKRLDATERLNRWIVQRGKKGEVQVAVDIHPLLSCGDPAVLCPRYRRFADDQVHWGKTGHERVADALYDKAFSDCR